MIELSVVIPSWNTVDLLRACLTYLYAADLPETEVIVIDNASADGSADMVAAEFSKATLERNAKNEGFAGGCNQGMRLAKGRYVLLLNSDTEVAPDAISLLLAWLDEHPEYGSAAPLLHSPDGTVQPSLKGFPTLRTALFFSTPLERWMPNSTELRRYFMRDSDQEASCDVDQPPAACLAIRKSVLDQVGLFDEDLWLFYNDVDLSKRMDAAGHKTRYVAEARVLHHEGASTSKFRGFLAEWQKNRLHYYRKHYGRLGGVWLKACVGAMWVDWTITQFWRRLKRTGADPVGETARKFLVVPLVMSVRDGIIETLARVLAWQLSHRDAEGRIVCPEHGVEHTGKSACAAITAAELWRATGDENHLVAAVQQGRRLVLNLEREGDSPCHTFRPGRHDPFNCSNSVIDGGACSDALAHLVTTLGSRLLAADREAFTAACVLHAKTYLRYAVLDKGIPAQRAWGMTGLAGAAALEPAEELARPLIEGVGMLEGIQNADGSYPYHPLDWGAEHPGASDVSSFYQSRGTAFLLYALQRAGRDPSQEPFRAPLIRGLDFLCALLGPDGIKAGLVEAKPWYWGAPYEVASHPFDVYALARGHALFGTQRYARAAAASYASWVAHLGDDGAPRSHHDGDGRGKSYQCATFWAAHACWIARALDELAACIDLTAEAPVDPTGDRGIDLAVTWLPDAELGRLEDDRIIAWVRGARPAFNLHHGSPHGAGLLRVMRKADGKDLLARCRLGGANEAEWSGKSGLPSPARGLDAGGRELRFSLWLARVHHRAGRTGAALRAPLDTFRRGVLAFAHPRVSSAFELAPETRVLGDGLHLTGRLCHRGGRPASGSVVDRVFRVDGGGLVVEERLVAPGRARGIEYAVPAAASDVERADGRISYRLS